MTNHRFYLLSAIVVCLFGCKSNFEKGKDAINEGDRKSARVYLEKSLLSKKYSDSSKKLIKEIDSFEDSVTLLNDSTNFIKAMKYYAANECQNSLKALNKIRTNYIRPTSYSDSFKVWIPIVEKKAFEEKKRIAEKLKKEKEEQRVLNIVETLNREIKSLKKTKYKVPQNATEVQMSIVLLAAYQKLIDINKNEKDYRIKKKLKTFKYLVRQHRIRTLPKLRRDYAKILKKILWEHDIKVKYWGKGNKYLEFVGGIFASNKGIKMVQESLKDTPTMLRYNQVRYRWYEGASEYTYYNLETPTDSKDYHLK